jgi:hypothetical protein
MSNNYFTKSGNPQSNSAGSSSLIRAEFAAVEAMGDKLAPLTGNGDKVVVINTPGTGQDVVARDVLVAGAMHAAAAKTPPVDADEFVVADSASSFALRKITWANIKAALDAIVSGVASGGTGAGSFTSGGLLRGNGTSPLTVASAADIVAAIGATAVANATSASSATNATNLNGSGTISSTTTATTQTAGDNSTKVATTAYVAAAVGAISAGAAVRGELKNLAASATGLSANVLVSADEIVVSSAANAYQTLRSVSLTIAGTTTGANALDTGTIAASTWYTVWVIWNGTTTAGLLSLGTSAPTSLPSGYTHYARVGWIRTDGTANKFPLGFKQYGRKVRYLIASGGNMTGAPVIVGGAAEGSTATPTWIAHSITGVVPTSASLITVRFTDQGGSSQSILAPNNSYGAYSSTSNPPFMVAGVNSATQIAIAMMGDMMLESTNVYTALGSSGAYLHCLGWEDNL